MTPICIPNATPEQCKKFEQYLSLLIKWNRVHNLTALQDPQEIVERHFLDSISVIPHLVGVQTLLDLGTGPGFPGLPIAIMRPDWRVTLVDATAKKIAFCQEVIRLCQLSNVQAIHGRAETLSGTMGKFDTIISRATWSLSDYLPIAIPFLQIPGGRVFAMKGPQYQSELPKPLPPPLTGPTITPYLGFGLNLPELYLIKYWAE